MVGRRKLVESVQYVTLSPLPLREFLLTPSTVDEIPTILPEQQVRLTLNIDLSQELWRLVNIWDFLRRMMRTECHASRTTTHGDRGIMSLYIQTSGIICYHYLSLGHTQHTIEEFIRARSPYLAPGGWEEGRSSSRWAWEVLGACCSPDTALRTSHSHPTDGSDSH